MTTTTSSNIEPIMLPGGRRRCPAPECDGRTFKSPQGWGAHSRMHRPDRNPARRTKNLGALRRKTVSCPVRGCSNRMLGQSLRPHLRAMHPELAPEEAVDMVNELVDAATPSRALERVEPERTRPSVRRVDVDDAAVAVLLGTTGNETIQIADVPAVADWLQHTRSLVRHLTDDETPR